MHSFSLASLKIDSTWIQFNLPVPGPNIFHDRLVTQNLCRSLVLPLVQKSLLEDFQIDPGHYMLEKKESGAPTLALRPGLKESLKHPPLSISISHSGPYIGIFLSDEEPVGLDLEDLSRQRSWGKLVQRFNKIDQDWIKKKGMKGFYQLWTGREALGKSLEKGLETALGLNIISWPSASGVWHPIEVNINPQPSEKKIKTKLFSILFNQKEDIFYSLVLASNPSEKNVPQTLRSHFYL
tara:strand:- start:420 stop:1133 length:714 start_codon:yes stop_codon:yes gene_type:complete